MTTPTDPFALLGVPRRFGQDIAALEQRHRDVSRTLHPDRVPLEERRDAAERAARVNEAFRTLRNPLSRASALLALAGREVGESSRASQAFLLEMLEMREALDEAAAIKDPAERTAKVTEIRAGVEAKIADGERAIREAFDALPEGERPAPEPLERAYEALVSFKYYYRLLDAADAALEEA